MHKVYLLHRFSGLMIADVLPVTQSCFEGGSLVANYAKHGGSILFYPAHHTLEMGQAVYADSPDGRLIAIALEKGGKLPLVGAPLKKGNGDVEV